MLCRPGETVWRLERADRAAVLLDMADYFKAAKAAMEGARRSIHLLGWAFDPDARFAPGEDGGGPSKDRIGAFLKHLACNRPELDVRLLVWKSALPIAASQNFFPHRARRTFRRTPVRFRLAADLPLGACHHQKMLVIDDEVAFVGGGDIAPDRWDTCDHLDDDPRRSRPRGRPFDARHEMMLSGDGPAARALGELFRERWLGASRQRLPLPEDAGVTLEGPTPWPACLEPSFRDAAIGVARTRPGWRGRPEVREAEALHLSAIAGARRLIYMENQYFASPVIAEALAARLEEPDGPEVVLISTLHSPSWFDRLTMDRTRLAFLERLDAADRRGRPGGGRLHAYCPVTAAGRPIIVHAKVTVIDDVMLRIGSANINNRSTGFDTECDVAVEARDGDAGAATRGAVRAWRTRMAAHWLGKPPAAVDAALARTGSLAAAIARLDGAGGPRRLRPLTPAALGPLAAFVAKHHLGDPAGPAASWRPWRRRWELETQLATLSHRLAKAGLPAPVDALSPETV